MAYLAMMTVRLVELRRVMKSTASLYLHCDPTASHYLKIILDGLFGVENFINEVVWKRSHAHNDGKQGSKHFGRITDSILLYGKSKNTTWNRLYRPYDQKYIDRDYRHMDPDGRRYRISDMRGPGGAEKGNPYYEVMGVWRHWAYSQEKMDKMIESGRVVQTRPGAVPQYKRYLDEMPGMPVQSLWDDLPLLNNRSLEVIGYPTQKPLSLLERIIQASSKPDDLVLDPFCGCGTAVHAAERLGRRWIGIDVTHLAIEVIESRIQQRCPGAIFEVLGRPVDAEGAIDLARRSKSQFQDWAIWRAGGQSMNGGKKGRDRGVDGQIFFAVGNDRIERAIISVKGGDNISPSFVRDLRGTVEREDAALGALILLREPTREMEREAAAAGVAELGGRRCPKIQIRTTAELLAGHRVDLPGWIEPMHPAPVATREQRNARRLQKPDPRQTEILFSMEGGQPDRPADSAARPTALRRAGAPSGQRSHTQFQYPQPPTQDFLQAAEEAPTSLPTKRHRRKRTAD